MTQLWTYFQLPAEGSTICKDLMQKTLHFFACLHNPSRRLLGNLQKFNGLEQSFHVWAPGKCQDRHYSILDRRVWELSTLMKTKRYPEPEATRLLPKKEGRTREIARFVVLKHGSSQLGRQKKCCLDQGSTEKWTKNPSRLNEAHVFLGGPLTSDSRGYV